MCARINKVWRHSRSASDKISTDAMSSRPVTPNARTSITELDSRTTDPSKVCKIAQDFVFAKETAVPQYAIRPHRRTTVTCGCPSEQNVPFAPFASCGIANHVYDAILECGVKHNSRSYFGEQTWWSQDVNQCQQIGYLLVRGVLT
nr:hypothetical protein CFP56_10082 [Quercus suber]